MSTRKKRPTKALEVDPILGPVTPPKPLTPDQGKVYRWLEEKWKGKDDVLESLQRFDHGPLLPTTVKELEDFLDVTERFLNDRLDTWQLSESETIVNDTSAQWLVDRFFFASRKIDCFEFKGNSQEAVAFANVVLEATVAWLSIVDALRHGKTVKGRERQLRGLARIQQSVVAVRPTVTKDGRTRDGYEKHPVTEQERAEVLRLNKELASEFKVDAHRYREIAESMDSRERRVRNIVEKAKYTKRR